VWSGGMTGGHTLGSMGLTKGGLFSANTSVALRVGTWESEYTTVGSLTVPVEENIVGSWMWPPTGIDMVGVHEAVDVLRYLSTFKAP